MCAVYDRTVIISSNIICISVWYQLQRKIQLSSDIYKALQQNANSKNY